MSEQPNYKKIVLDYVITQSASDDTTDLRMLAEQTDYGVDKLVEQESELYPAVNSGVSPAIPWVWERSEAERLYEAWGAEPPAEIDSVDWVDQ